ncbi:MAG: GDSL-type esterase/lipase family protein [Planctomycetota bacterium]
MKQILVYGDSLSWGIIPGTRQRFEFDVRWPGAMEKTLVDLGHDVRVIEDCLNGRTTSLEHTSKPGRNGAIGIEQRIEVNSPLVLVIIFLGINDFQSMHQMGAHDTAQRIKRLVEAVRQAPIEAGMVHPDVLLIAPPLIRPSADPIRYIHGG